MTRRHGTSVKYVQDRCRCGACKAANRHYERERAARIEPPYVSAGPARRHVEELRAAGVGLKQVAKTAGVPHGSLSKLVYGDRRRGMGPSKRIRPGTAERILAVTPADIAEGARVPAGPTWENVERLVAAGVPRVRIAERIGQTRSLQLGRQWVQARHAREIAAMAAELDAGTLVTVRRHRHGDRTVTAQADAETRDEARRAVEAHRRAKYRAAERGEAPPSLVYDDRDQFYLAIAELLEDRIDQAEWRAEAACRGRPSWMWFPSPGDWKVLAAAKRVCNACLVRDECRTVHLHERDGVWGGLSASDRRALRTSLEVAL